MRELDPIAAHSRLPLSAVAPLCLCCCCGVVPEECICLCGAAAAAAALRMLAVEAARRTTAAGPTLEEAERSIAEKDGSEGQSLRALRFSRS